MGWGVPEARRQCYNSPMNSDLSGRTTTTTTTTMPFRGRTLCRGPTITEANFLYKQREEFKHVCEEKRMSAIDNLKGPLGLPWMTKKSVWYEKWALPRIFPLSPQGQLGPPWNTNIHHFLMRVSCVVTTRDNIQSDLSARGAKWVLITPVWTVSWPHDPAR